MKILKTLLVLLLLLVVIGVIAMLVLPKKMEITRTVEVDAPASITWNQVNSLRGMMAWSPWAELDTNQTVEYDGEDGAVGSFYTWSGNDKVGEGKQTVTAVDAENKNIQTYLEFFAPWESQANVSLQVEDAGEGKSKVSWTFEQELGMPNNLIMTLMGMKGALSKDFDKGLGYLKDLAESTAEEAANEPVIEVQTMMRDSGAYMIKRERLLIADLKTYFEQKMPEYYGTAMQSGIGDTNRPASAMYFTWEEETGEAELSVAVPVVAGAEAPEGFEIAYMPGGTNLVVEFYGPYEQTGAAHEAIEAYMQANSTEYRGPVMEEYVTDPMSEPDPNKWLTRVIYPIVDPAASATDDSESDTEEE